MKTGQLAACVDSGFGCAIVARATDKIEKLVEMLVDVQHGFALTGCDQQREREPSFCKQWLNRMGKSDPGRVIFAMGTSFKR